MEDSTLYVDDAQVSAALELLGNAGDSQLSRAISVLLEVQRSRAEARGDLEALLEMGFDEGFDQSGHAKLPFIHAGIIICPGSLVEKSSTAHECAFVHLGETWVWEYEDLLLDEVRRGVLRSKNTQRSVSLLPASPGLELDLIRSKKRQGTHTMTSVISYRVDDDGKLEVVSTRTPRADKHR